MDIHQLFLNQDSINETLQCQYQPLYLSKYLNNEIIDAIKNKHVCELSYEDDASIGPGRRVIVQPVAFGESLRNNKVVRAYQTIRPLSLKVNEEGIPLPDWRLFRVDRMNNFKPM